MNINAARVMMLLGAIAASTQAAQAAPEAKPPKGLPQQIAQEFGPSLPPIGYVNYCLENNNDCVANFSLFASQGFSLTAERLETLARINTEVNHRVEAVSDQELYGKAEVWTMPNGNRGDCEDYVLLKKHQLQAADFPVNALRITVVLDENGEGHAILTVTAKEGDFILDNRRDDILRWHDTQYTFIKRQSANNPRQWVSLRAKETSAFGSLSASQSHD